MINTLLFATIVLIWDSAWVMIKFQIGVVAAEVSVAIHLEKLKFNQGKADRVSGRISV